MLSCENEQIDAAGADGGVANGVANKLELPGQPFLIDPASCGVIGVEMMVEANTRKVE